MSSKACANRSLAYEGMALLAPCPSLYRKTTLLPTSLRIKSKLDSCNDSVFFSSVEVSDNDDDSKENLVGGLVDVGAFASPGDRRKMLLSVTEVLRRSCRMDSVED